MEPLWISMDENFQLASVEVDFDHYFNITEIEPLSRKMNQIPCSVPCSVTRQLAIASESPLNIIISVTTPETRDVYLKVILQVLANKLSKTGKITEIDTKTLAICVHLSEKGYNRNDHRSNFL